MENEWYETGMERGERVAAFDEVYDGKSVDGFTAPVFPDAYPTTLRFAQFFGNDEALFQARTDFERGYEDGWNHHFETEA